MRLGVSGLCPLCAHSVQSSLRRVRVLEGDRDSDRRSLVHRARASLDHQLQLSRRRCEPAAADMSILERGLAGRERCGIEAASQHGRSDAA